MLISSITLKEMHALQQANQPTFLGTSGLMDQMIAGPGGKMNKDPRVDKVARAIYESQREEYEEVTGKTHRAWRIEGVEWDRLAEVELCEWERDEYRSMAEAAIKALED